MVNISRAALAASVLAAAVVASAQFDIRVNPHPVRNRVTATVFITVPDASWQGGRPRGWAEVLIRLRHKRTRQIITQRFPFSIIPTGPQTGRGTFRLNWHPDFQSVPGSELRVFLDNGWRRTIPIKVQ